MGLLREKTPEDETGPSSANGGKEGSPFREVMQTLDRPPTADFTSPPRSADYIKKPSFFQSFASRAGKANFRLPRSSSMRTPSPPPPAAAAAAGSSPDFHPPLGARPSQPATAVSSPSAAQASFTALSRIRKSLRDKKATSTAGVVSLPGPPGSPAPGTPVAPAGTPGGWSPKRFATADDRAMASLRDELQASKDEAAASKEVISVLRKQVETLQMEKETLSDIVQQQQQGSASSPGGGGALDVDAHLLDILRTKDGQIVELEIQARDQQKVIDLQENQVGKLKEEIRTYQTMLEVRKPIGSLFFPPKSQPCTN